MSYELSSDFVVRNIVDECLIVRVENCDEENNTFYAINPTGKIIIDSVIDGKDFDEIVKAIFDNFDIEKSQAEADVREFIAKFSELGVIIDK